MGRLRTLLIVVGTLAVLAAACGGSDDPAAGSPDAGTEIAPIFAVETTDGEFSLSDHLANDGRPLFLNLWASWCFPCREEMPAIDASAAAHPGVEFIGVAVQDSRTDAQAFADEIAVEYLLGFDDDGSVDASYAPLGLPASYIISSDGIILETILGKVTEEDLAEKFDRYFGSAATEG